MTSRDYHGRSALDRASFGGHTDVVNRLLEAGARISAQADGQIALHDASINGHLVVVEGLLKAGADVSTLSNSGATAVHLASWHGHSEVADRLLQSNANSGWEQEDRSSHHDPSRPANLDTDNLQPCTGEHSWKASLWAGNRPYRGKIANSLFSAELIRQLDDHAVQLGDE